MSWEPVIGLEIHVHLKTRTKMFCRCELEYFAPENSRTCPVCLAHPGTLPVPNRRAIEMTILLGLGLGCRDRRARDLPSQALLLSRQLPRATRSPSTTSRSASTGCSCSGQPRATSRSASCAPTSRRTPRRTCTWAAPAGGIAGADRTLVDFNRAGTPLVEIVTAPDIHSAEHAKRFLQLLRQTVVELGISDAEMEKGSLRFDVNVSVRPEGSDELRTRTELKNMNSFNFAAKGIEREIQRQIQIYESGGEVVQETMHFDPGNESAPPLRSKEEAQDYRYLPEPDLVPLEPDRELVERLRGELPELPGERIRRLADEVGFESAEGLVTSGRDHLFEKVSGDRREVANVLMNQFAATGVDPAAVERRRAGEADRCPRPHPAPGLHRSSRGQRRRRLLGGELPRRRADHRSRRPRAARRPDPGREPGAGRVVPGRQGGAARLLRRSSDEGDGGPREPEARQRAAAREAEVLSIRAVA